VNGVKAFQGKRHCVRLVELEGVIRLRLDVHSHHLEAGTVITHRRTTSSAEEI
jgi:hypothetical protein